MQKENTIRQLSQILGASSPLIFKPIIQPHKYHLMGSKKRNWTNCTKREPSYFEIVEKTARKCGSCDNSGQNHSTSSLNNKTTRPNWYRYVSIAFSFVLWSPYFSAYFALFLCFVKAKYLLLAIFYLTKHLPLY